MAEGIHTTREQRRQLARENLKWPLALVEIPRSQWHHPEPQTMRWSELEIRWIKAYATAAVQQYREDAERYRWLRDPMTDLCLNDMFDSNGSLLVDSLLDAAIDAARKAKP